MSVKYIAIGSAVLLVIALSVALVERSSNAGKVEESAGLRLQTPMIGGSMQYRREGPWPECLSQGMTGKQCARFIGTGAEDVRNNIVILSESEDFPSDFQEDRVVIRVDADGYVTEPIPGRG
uniref:Uncharacterized protein n=1 Tax=Pseudictyota dubia TaxID=2749911 RepID=A0A7R9ZJ48_9STRA|mmetsp:Transcript_7936/g.14436  ORF Transcript_7936/g.14436 Transcript_7936/m.14436 type:complete len:122 (+) Transcript_7936:51-416(+)